MTEDRTVTRDSDNIFADLNLPNADEHMVKAQMVRLIANRISEHGLSQVEAGKIIGLAQPDVSKLLRGRFEGFGLERIISFALRLGIDVEIKAKTHAKTEPEHQGRLSMMVA